MQKKFDDSIKGADVRALERLLRKPEEKIKDFIDEKIRYDAIIRYSFITGERNRLKTRFENIANDLLELLPDTIAILGDNNQHEIAYPISKKIKVIQERLKDCQKAYKERN